MYRSDEDRDALIAPAAAEPAPVEAVVVDVLPPRSWRQAPNPPDPPPSAPLQLPQQLSYGALSLGISAMMLPLVITMFVVLLPVRWFLGTGESRMDR